jgi:hypothetical protein
MGTTDVDEVGIAETFDSAEDVLEHRTVQELGRT